MNKSIRTVDALAHIREAIDKIERYTADLNQDSFGENELTQDAVVRNIEIIGEAANRILRHDPEFAATNSHIPWPVMYAMRNRVSHGYDQVDLTVVWNLVQRELPALRAQILSLITEWPSER